MNTPQTPQLHKHIVMPSCLQLSLKYKWFEMTKARVKTEDYRELTNYWFKRLFDKYVTHEGKLVSDDVVYSTLSQNKDLIMKYNKPKSFGCNIMTKGYPKSNDTERILTLEHKGIEIRTGNPEWGAEPGKLYFVIMHGAILA